MGIKHIKMVQRCNGSVSTATVATLRNGISYVHDSGESVMNSSDSGQLVRQEFNNLIVAVVLTVPIGQQISIKVSNV